jgi:hypothetical protein
MPTPDDGAHGDWWVLCKQGRISVLSVLSVLMHVCGV